MFNRSVCGALLLLTVTAGTAEEKKALPDPLSLEQAIAFIDEQHPNLVRAQIKVDQSALDHEFAMSEKSLTLKTNARLRWVDPEDDALYDEHTDHFLGITATKPLYDAGRSNALAEAATLQGESASLQYAHERDQHIIKVMRYFFESIVADLRASRDIEAMSVRFVRMDRGRDRHELGEISDIELAELESLYQASRRKLYASEADARSARSKLANALNRPDEKPSRLMPPSVSLNNIELLSIEEVLKQVLNSNHALKANNATIEAARARVKAARATGGPRINSVLERAEYSRVTRATDKWRVALEMEWPIYDGGKSDIETRRAQLAVTEVELRRRDMMNQLRHDVGQLVDHVRTLKAQGDASVAYTNFRELYLDRSRALYEMEVKTDLGDSMIEISESHVRAAQQRFELILAVAQLNALAGKPVNDWQALAKKEAMPSTQEVASEKQSNP